MSSPERSTLRLRSTRAYVSCTRSSASSRDPQSAQAARNRRSKWSPRSDGASSYGTRGTSAEDRSATLEGGTWGLTHAACAQPKGTAGKVLRASGVSLDVWKNASPGDPHEHTARQAVSPRLRGDRLRRARERGDRG